MTDKELLELAAKAIGVEITFANGVDDDGYDNGVWKYTWIRSNGKLIFWNPLSDDRDALRLAVKLNIEFACFDDSEQTNAGVWTPDSKPFNCMTSYDGDKYAAVRRAIVRAAADIGKNMQ